MDFQTHDQIDTYTGANIYNTFSGVYTTTVHTQGHRKDAKMSIFASYNVLVFLQTVYARTCVVFVIEEISCKKEV